MPLKPIFDKAPLTAMTAAPLCAGLVRSENAAMAKLYALTSAANETAALEGTFRLACIVTAKPGEEPVAAKIRALLSTQQADGSFALSIKDSVALLRACWAIYEYEARKPMLEHIARWCAYTAKNWDAVMDDDDIWTNAADLLELLENLYRVTGKAAVLSLCEQLATQSMSWSSVLNTVSSQRATNKSVTREELVLGIAKEADSREGYYNRFYYANHAESLADGARSTMAKGCYSGSATELNATRNGWERLYRYHGAICGGLTSDEMVEGTAPNAAVSTAALGAWAEALASAAMNEQSDWAVNALERMVFNAMPACVTGDAILPFQCVNTLTGQVDAKHCFYASNDHAARALTRLVRGYAAVASMAVTAREDGASVNLYMPGYYAVPVEDELLRLTISATAKGANITVHCKADTKATVRLRMPSWSRNTEVTINGAASPADVKNGVMVYERNWQDGDVLVLTFEQAVMIETGHHQGKYVLCGPVLMAVQPDIQWQNALIKVSMCDNRVLVDLQSVKEWKLLADEPADIPVLPEVADSVSQQTMVPYAKTTARIALFPGRKQA